MGSSTHTQRRSPSIRNIRGGTLSQILDSRAVAQSDLRRAVYVRPLGLAEAVVKDLCSDQEFAVSNMTGRTFTPGSVVSLGSYHGLPGEFLIAGPVAGQGGAAAFGIAPVTEAHGMAATNPVSVEGIILGVLGPTPDYSYTGFFLLGTYLAGDGIANVGPVALSANPDPTNTGFADGCVVHIEVADLTGTRVIFFIFPDMTGGGDSPVMHYFTNNTDPSWQAVGRPMISNGIAYWIECTDPEGATDQDIRLMSWALNPAGDPEAEAVIVNTFTVPFTAGPSGQTFRGPTITLDFALIHAHRSGEDFVVKLPLDGSAASVATGATQASCGDCVSLYLPDGRCLVLSGNSVLVQANADTAPSGAGYAGLGRATSGFSLSSDGLVQVCTRSGDLAVARFQSSGMSSTPTFFPIDASSLTAGGFSPRVAFLAI